MLHHNELQSVDTLVRIRDALTQARDEPSYSDKPSLRFAVQMLRAEIDDCRRRRVRWKTIASAFRAAGYADASEHVITTYHQQEPSLRARAMLDGSQATPELKKALGNTQPVRKLATKTPEKPAAQPPAKPVGRPASQAESQRELPQIEEGRGHTVARGGFD